MESIAAPGCAPTAFGTGAGRVIPASEVHQGANTGPGPAVIYTAFVGVPPGSPLEVDAARPANCPVSTRGGSLPRTGAGAASPASWGIALAAGGLALRRAARPVRTRR